MALTTLLAYAVGLQTAFPQTTFEAIRDAVGRGNWQRIESYFQRPSDASYLFEMAERRDGIRSIKVSFLPVPPGWEATGRYWAVFHTRQDIEQDHDPVHGIVLTETGFKIGKEIPEWSPQSAKIRHLRTHVSIYPQASSMTAESEAELEPWTGNGALVFRLNDIYQVSNAEVDGSMSSVSKDVNALPKEGDVVRAGSLVVVWRRTPPAKLKLYYSGKVQSEDEDKISANVAYLTAWWTPSLARLPHTSEVRVATPEGWHAVSEGVETKPEDSGFGPFVSNRVDAVKSFRCDVPISYPKAIAGKYTLAAEAKDAKGRTFRAYHLDPVEPARAKRDVDLMLKGIAFFEKNLGEWPFPGYACYDADTYYGIESYSHTLLRRSITTQFITHEMGHTYFGGLAPSAYVRDSWNEGVTQYVDSVVLNGNSDNTLQMALQSMRVNVPLSRMSVAHAHQSTTYWRGAYVMKMLEAEIGADKVMAGLREVVQNRRGRDTVWADLRPYFEKTGGKSLDWFWRQWIDSATFPTLRIREAQLIQREGKWSTFVTVEQTGSPAPYRMRFKVQVRSVRGVLGEKVVKLTGNQEAFRVDSDTAPTEALVDVFPMTLAYAPEPVKVRR